MGAPGAPARKTQSRDLSPVGAVLFTVCILAIVLSG